MKTAVINIGIIMVMIAAGVIGTITLVRSVVASPEEEQPAALIEPPIASVAPEAQAPVRLAIPAIGVNANVQHVGISKRGTMAVPIGYADVGWYRYGPAPGAAGSAVMAGHLDNGFGLAAVFKRLKELEPGDDVYVTDSAGARVHFKVVRKASFSSEERSTGEVFGPAGRPRLNLITCEGEWDPSRKTYSNRLVVFTELVNP